MSNYKYFLKEIAQHNQEVIVLSLADSEGRSVFNFQPGQYVMIAYVNQAGVLEQRHAFSIASSPSQNSSLMLGIKMGGNFTKGLLNLKVGTPISVSGPFGKFVFKPNKHKDLVLIAGGIGITPFLSTMQFATDNQLDNKLALLYSARTLAAASFYKKIKQLEFKNPNLKTLFSITDEQIPAGTEGMINERISSQVISDFVGDVSGKTFFICGPVPFMEAIKNNLLLLGVNKSKIQMEAFSMMDDSNFWPQLRNFSYATGFSAVIVASVFYSIVNANALTKSLKSSSNFLNPAGLIKFFSEEDKKANTNVNSNTPNVNTPTPTTNVSGVTPSTSSTMPSSNNQNTNPSNQQYNNSLPSSTPQPVTSTSIPVQSQRSVSSPITKSPSVNTNNNIAVPQPITASSTPINQNNINNGGYRGDDGAFDD